MFFLKKCLYYFGLQKKQNIMESTFKDFLNGFHNSSELETWAFRYNLSHIAEVKNRIDTLKLEEILQDEISDYPQHELDVVLQDLNKKLSTNEQTKQDSTSNVNDGNQPSTSTTPHPNIQPTYDEYDSNTNVNTSQNNTLDSDPSHVHTENTHQTKRKPHQDTNEHPHKKQKINFNIDENDRLYTLSSRNSKSFRGDFLLERTFDVNFNNSLMGAKLLDIKLTLQKVFNTLLNQSRSEFQSTDMARIYINHSDLKKPIIIPPKPLADFSPESILANITSTLQSAEHLTLNETFSIQLGIAKLKTGGARTYITNLEKDRVSKRSIISIRNVDGLCLPRALVVGNAFNDKVNAAESEQKKLTKYYSYIRRGDMGRQTSLQKRKALELMISAGVPIDQTGCMTHIPLYEAALNVDIIIFGLSAGRMCAIYPENKTLNRKNRIYLLYSETPGSTIGHFDCVVKLTGLLCKDYFCSLCLCGFNDPKSHSCKRYCSACRSDVCVYEENIPCSDCNGVFRSLSCYQRHKQTKGKYKKPLCELYWNCAACKLQAKRSEHKPENHICGNYVCFFCKDYVDDSHQCFLRYNPVKKEISKFIFYDFETDIVSQNSHHPLYCIAQSMCPACEDITFEETIFCQICGTRCEICDGLDFEGGFLKPPCPEVCGKREHIFSGENCSEMFCEWLLNKQNKNSIAFAHAARSYDNYFLIEYMLKNGIIPNVIFDGSKIMYATVQNGLNIALLDSLNFLPMPLCKLPKCFDIQGTLKGFFPYFYLTPDTMDYVGQIPEQHYFGVKSMKTDRRTEFLNWYDSVKDKQFDMKDSLEKYTRDDVKILRLAMMKFRNLVLNITSTSENANGLDPFKYVTLASLVMGIYKKLFLRETVEVNLVDGTCTLALRQNENIYINDRVMSEKNPLISQVIFKKSQIAASNPKEQRKALSYSNHAILWIEYEAFKRSVFIEHALNVGEKKVRAPSGRLYSLDGFYLDENTGQRFALEYEGCLYHSCGKCYPDDTVQHPFFKTSMLERRVATEKKVAYLQSLGFTVLQMWECEFDRLLKEDEELIVFSKTVDLTPRLLPREALFGGRTDACKLFYEAKPGETIRYFDYTSLYPSVLKKSPFISGHPRIIRCDFQSIENYFGIAKIQILPPRALYHAVLPVKMNGKLCFPLCMKCCKSKNPNPCQCREVDRMLHGSWTTVEILKAIEKGYVVKRIHEVFHWDTVSSMETNDGLFSEFVDTFLKIKQESSDWPDWVITDTDKEKYIEDYFTHEGIRLSPENIKANPGLRSISKLFLNSLWGKFAQKSNLKRSKFIDNEAQFYSILCDRTSEISDWRIISPTIAQVEYSMVSGFEQADANSNLYIAIFTTSYARLKLYELIDRLGDNTIYLDTDSVIFKHTQGEYMPELGDFLGDLTCETPNTHITQFVSTGAKSYGYELANGEYEIRVKGFTVTHENGKRLNFHTMKQMVLDFQKNEESDVITLNYPNQITRNAKKFTIHTTDATKEFSITLDKRRIDYGSLNTYPYGY